MLYACRAVEGAPRHLEKEHGLKRMRSRLGARIGSVIVVVGFALASTACGDPNQDPTSEGTGGMGGNTSATGGASSSDTRPSTGAPLWPECSGEEGKFSFFLASFAALIKLSGNVDGFGGNLGGLSGADALCQTIAEKSAPCHKGRVVWHAFLSTKDVAARDRIGTGPWYDRRGRLLAENLSNLLRERPLGADAAIVNDFPNENGTPNHNPDGTGDVDNHEILTGTGVDGRPYTQTSSVGGIAGTSCGPRGEERWTIDAATCWGWTTSLGKGCPRVGHSWPRQMSGNHWISVYNEGGCAPGGNMYPTSIMDDGPDGTRRVGAAGGYGGFYCFAVTGG